MLAASLADETTAEAHGSVDIPVLGVALSLRPINTAVSHFDGLQSLG